MSKREESTSKHGFRIGKKLIKKRFERNSIGRRRNMKGSVTPKSRWKRKEEARMRTGIIKINAERTSKESVDEGRTRRKKRSERTLGRERRIRRFYPRRSFHEERRKQKERNGKKKDTYKSTLKNRRWEIACTLRGRGSECGKSI